MSDKVVGTVTVETPITQEMVDDLISAAFDGGITYWCDCVQIVDRPTEDDYEYTSDVVSRGGTLSLSSEEPTKYLLTLERFLIGFGMLCKHLKRSVEDLYENNDAEIADWIVQFAVFGELIYG